VWLQAISPQIHLELNPDLKLSADIGNSPPITEDSVMTLQDAPCIEETDSPEKVATVEEEKVKPDWSGLKRDTLYFIGYQVALIGILYVLPEAVTGWSDESKNSYEINRWTENVKKIVWDDDKWYVNYFFHPYWGSIYYIRARERGLEKFDSFLYSALSSAIFEFGIEALFEEPSIQDLIATPVLGTLLGMYFEKLRGGIKAKGDQQKWYDKVALVLTDPLGTLNKYTDRLLGIQSTVELKSFRLPLDQYKETDLNYTKTENFGSANMISKSPLGVELKFAW
jgi:hypothetical protein